MNSRININSSTRYVWIWIHEVHSYWLILLNFFTNFGNFTLKLKNQKVSSSRRRRRIRHPLSKDVCPFVQNGNATIAALEYTLLPTLHIGGESCCARGNEWDWNTRSNFFHIINYRWNGEARLLLSRPCYLFSNFFPPKKLVLSKNCILFKRNLPCEWLKLESKSTFISSLSCRGDTPPFIDLKYWLHLLLPASFFSRFSFALLEKRMDS